MVAHRKPTALKLLHGDDKHNPGRINRREPKPRGPVEPPTWLSGPAREIWDAIAPEMILTGVLTHWDVPVFAELCESLIVVRAARLAAMREIGGKAEVVPGQTSPTAAWYKAMNVIVQLAARYGITPADRSRLVTPEAPLRRTSGHDDLLSG